MLQIREWRSTSVSGTSSSQTRQIRCGTGGAGGGAGAGGAAVAGDWPPPPARWVSAEPRRCQRDRSNRRGSELKPRRWSFGRSSGRRGKLPLEVSGGTAEGRWSLELGRGDVLAELIATDVSILERTQRP